jgi:PhzF family phenazine biosynthesis protein
MALELPIYQVDAFADAVFGGNPAAVVVLRDWLPDSVLQAIAAENNLAETAFLVAENGGYALRWFTPTIEVDLCGHATLASAAIVFEFLKPASRHVVFATRTAGRLTVTHRADGLLEMDFPARPAEPVASLPGLAEALGAEPREMLANGMLLALFDHADEVAALAPDFRKLAALPYFGVIATAPGMDGYDFVSRFFAPQAGIDEDPVTGSAHCALAPFWSRRLGRKSLVGRQISARGGTIHVQDCGSRVLITGRARLYLEGRIFLPNGD